MQPRLLTAIVLIVSALVQGLPAQLVREGIGGLIYTAYANQGQAQEIHQVPDFSRSGYRGGGVPIPFVPAAIVLSPSGGNDTVAIQNAINYVASLPVAANGFRGAVVLLAGDYTVSGTLRITAGGVVIRGHGQGVSGGTRILYTSTVKSNLFEFNGSSGPSVTGSTFTVAETLVPVGSRTVTVSNASSFVPGDLIRITNTVNQKWIDDIGMGPSGVMGSSAWTPGSYQLRHFRYVEAVRGNVITLDAPVMQAIETQYGGATVQRFTWAGALEHVGLEGLRLESTYLSDTDENHGWYAVTMRNVRHGWVRQVTARYFGQGLAEISANTQFVTVEDCAHLDPKSTTAGGRRYSFAINQASYNLVQRSLTRNGRHDFVTGSRTPGPNVFLDCLATVPINDSGPHHRYSMGHLYDNVRLESNLSSSNDALRVQNRTTSGSGHGWSGAQIMFWNCNAPELVADAPVGAMNWAVGNVGLKAASTRSPWEPFGIWESHLQPVLPRSLYAAQLRDRLGLAALQEIILPAQAEGTLWAALKAWDGNGMLLDPVVAFFNTTVPPAEGRPLSIVGRVRDLQVLDAAHSFHWEQLSGSGTASFANPALDSTTVVFDEPGRYVLLLRVEGSGRVLQTQLTVDVGDFVELPEDPVPGLIDFGTDPGKLTATEAGFGVFLGGSGQVLDRADGAEWRAALSSGFENFAFMQTFPGLGAGQPVSFRLEAEVRVNELVGTNKENNDRWGFKLFGTTGNELSDMDGITPLVLARGDTLAGAPVDALVLIRSGLNGSTLASATWVGGPIRQGDALRLETEGIFRRADQLELSFTVSRLDGTDQQTVQTVLPLASLLGDRFGGTMRMKNGRAVEYDTFRIELLRDVDGNGIDDLWEFRHFGQLGLTDGSTDTDGDGVADFFEYLHGSDPTDPDDGGFRIGALPGADGSPVFVWEVMEHFKPGVDYNIRISTDLRDWSSLPPAHYSLRQMPAGDRRRMELTLTHDYGDQVFLILAKP